MSTAVNSRFFRDLRSGALALPVVFVFLWSTGFIAVKIGLNAATPFTFLAIRFIATVLLLAGLSVASRAPWPSPRQWPSLAVAGILLHAGYLGGVFAALSHGVGAGAVAVIVGLQPVVTGVLAGPLLGEKISVRHWGGMALGLLGVTAVMFGKLRLGLGTGAGMAFALLAMVSITFGTLWQKRYGAGMDLRTGTCVQNIAAAVVTLPWAFHEGWHVEPTISFILSLAWLCIALSTISIFAMFVLIERGAASKVASLFFLVPPTTAFIAWIIFGEHLDPVSLAGTAMTVVAVVLVTTHPRP